MRPSGLKAGPGKGIRFRFYRLITYFLFVKNLGLHILGIIWTAHVYINHPPQLLKLY